MSMGGHSFHKQQWMEAAALAGLGATGAGAMGVGPLAGLMGTAPAAAGNVAGAMAALPASGAAELAAAGPATPGIASTIAQTSLLGHAIDPSSMSRFGKGLQMANSLMQPPQAPAPMGPHGGAAPPAPPTILYPQAMPTGFNPSPDEAEKLIKWLERQPGVMT